VDTSGIIEENHNFAGYLSTLLRRWWLFVLIPVVFVVAIYWLTPKGATSYTATTTLLVNPIPSTNAISSGDVYAAQVLAQSYSQMVSLPDVYARTLDRLRVQGLVPPAKLGIGASVDVNSLLLHVSATTGDASMAAAASNAAASAFLDWLSDLETVSGQSNATTPTSRVVIVAPAELPSATHARIPSLAYPILGGVFGLGLAGVVAFGLDMLVRRIRLPNDIQKATMLPVLAAVPPFNRGRVLDLTSDPDSAASRAVRLLHTRFQFQVNGTGPGVTAVIATAPGDDAARLAANLGVAFAEEGHRVIMVDADASSPRLGAVLGVKRPGSGLAAAISNPTVNLESLLVDGPHPGVRLLLSESPAAGATWLKSDTIINLVRRLKGISDAVILVVPPVASSAEALLWIAAADHALLGVSVGKTRTGELREAAGSVQLAGTPIMGAALLAPGGGIPSLSSRLH